MGDSYASKEEVSTLKESIDRLEKMMEKLITDRGHSPTDETSSANPEASLHGPLNSAPVDRGPRLDFPLFSGTEDPLSWLYRCELYFMNQNVPPAKRVSTAAYYLAGDAQLWYHHLCQDHPHLSWDYFRDYCIQRFGPPGGANPLGDLTNLKQQGRPVEDYITDFQTRLSRVPPLRMEYQVSIFTAGLDEVLRLDVEYQKPLNLTMAINVARLFAKKLQLWTSSQAHQSGMPPKKPMEPPSQPSNLLAAVPSTHTNSPPPIKRLSKTEAAERRAKGLCYNCDETFTPEHRCKRLFCLWMEDEHEEDACNSHTELTASLYAMVGLAHPKNLQIRVQLANHFVLAMIDSGSTQNFIDAQTALSLGLPITKHRDFRVAMANGEELRTRDVCERVQLSKKGVTFLINLLVLPLTGFEVILGMKWLEELGDISCNFRTHTFTFTLQGKTVTWSGDTPTNGTQPTMSNEQAMEVSMSSFDSIFNQPTSRLPPRKYEATWENIEEFQPHFPTFKLEDKLDFNGGSNDACLGINTRVIKQIKPNILEKDAG